MKKIILILLGLFFFLCSFLVLHSKSRHVESEPEQVKFDHQALDLTSCFLISEEQFNI